MATSLITVISAPTISYSTILLQKKNETRPVPEAWARRHQLSLFFRLSIRRLTRSVGVQQEKR